MTMRNSRLIACLMLIAGTAIAAPFENLGVPVRKAGLMGAIVGPGPDEGSQRLYFNFRQEGGKLFLVAVDPATGDAKQYKSPAGTGAWGFIVGPDNRIYLGTHEGPDPQDSGQILVFDPKQPENEIQIVGRPAESETYIWMYTLGKDGTIYGCTFPGAKLVSYDPATGTLADHGVMDPSQKYARSICTGADGRIYLGIGFGQANVIVFDPATGEHKAILPQEYRKDPAQTVATVYAGVDGKVYVKAIRIAVLNGDPQNGELTRPEEAVLVANGDTLEEALSPAVAVSQTRLADGTELTGTSLDGDYELVHPDGRSEKKHFDYAGDGSGVFMVSAGPLGRIYGGTWMPCQIFSYDPATGAMENPGNPTEVGGEIYSMLEHHGVLYVCAYPGAFLSRWDPSKPWDYGREASNNPLGYGPLGPGHLRPRAMIHGPNEMIYIGSYPEYGRHGGSLGVWDPERGKLIENYHPLVKDQAVASLLYDTETKLIFGGTSTAGGGGTDPVTPSAKLFAFDPEKKKLTMEQVPYPEAQTIHSLAQVGRKIYGLAGDDSLFIYDIDAGEMTSTGALGVGPIPDCSLGLWKDGQLYGLAKKKVFKLDPTSFQVTVLAEYDGEIQCGFAMDEHGIYFGERASLMRYNWPVAGKD